ncbi:MAG: transglutaminase domain-containing protein, partial [Clostridia bacterium]|nr:transglutaminase domain-containing protein [Clostridia bacterium]
RDNLFYEFPPSALCTWTADEKSLSLRFTYTYERSEHLEKLASFGDTVEDIIQKSLLFGDGEAEKAILLYHEIAYTVDYFQVDYTKAETNAYTALTEKKAICYSFSDAYNYLLRQVGVRAYLVKGYRSGDRAAHGWSLVEIDGRYYHCDATWEYSMLDGIGLYYFAMSDSRRQKNVVLAEATVGEGILKNKLTLKADSDRFTGINGDKFREKTWTLDREKEAIVYRGREYSYQAQ